MKVKWTKGLYSDGFEAKSESFDLELKFRFVLTLLIAPHAVPNRKNLLPATAATCVSITTSRRPASMH